MSDVDEDFWDRAKGLVVDSEPNRQLDGRIFAYAHAKARHENIWRKIARYSAGVAAVVGVALGVAWGVNAVELKTTGGRDYAELWDFNAIEEATAEVSLNAEFNADYMLAWTDYRGNGK